MMKMLTARTILCPNLLQMSRQHPKEDWANIQNDAHKSTEAPMLEGNGWLLAKIARPHMLRHIPITFMWSQLANEYENASHTTNSSLEKTHWWIQGYKWLNTTLSRYCPGMWDWIKQSNPETQNSEVRF